VTKHIYYFLIITELHKLLPTALQKKHANTNQRYNIINLGNIRMLVVAGGWRWLLVCAGSM